MNFPEEPAKGFWTPWPVLFSTYSPLYPLGLCHHVGLCPFILS